MKSLLCSLKPLLVVTALVCSGASQETAQGTTFAKLDASALPIVRKIHIGGDPDWISIGFGSVWVSVPKTNEIVRVDPVRNTVQARVALSPDNEPCYGIGIGSTRVWVLNCHSQTLARINPVKNKVDLRIPASIDGAGEGGIAVSRNRVWFVSNEDGHSSTLTQVSSYNGRTLRKISVGRDSAVVKLGFFSVWVISSGEGKVYRVDPKQGKVRAKITVHAVPRFATVGAGSLWILSQSDGSVSRIDPVRNKVSAVIPAQVPGTGGEICYGGGFIWVTMNGTPVTRIDPVRNRVVDQYGNYKNADAIRYGFGSIWVSDHGKGDLWRIDPRKLQVSEHPKTFKNGVAEPQPKDHHPSADTSRTGYGILRLAPQDRLRRGDSTEKNLLGKSKGNSKSINHGGKPERASTVQPASKKQGRALVRTKRLPPHCAPGAAL